MGIRMSTLMCKGFMEDCEPERVEEIFGKELYDSVKFPDICDWFTHACDFNCWFRPWTECYRYDLTDLTLNGHEVACAYADLGGLATNAQYHILAKWYDQDGNHLFTNQSGYITGTERYRWVCWIGYCDWEIAANGWHKVIMELYEDDSLVKSNTIDFEILGVPIDDPCEAEGRINSISTPAEASEGDSIDLCATIENIGGSSGMFFLRFYDGSTMVRETLPGNVAPEETIEDVCEYFTMPGHAWSGKIELMRQT